MIPIVIFRSLEEVQTTLGHIAGAYQVSQTTLGAYMPPSAEINVALAECCMARWAIDDENQCAFQVIIYDDEDTNDVPFCDIHEIQRMCREIFKPQRIKPVMVVDSDASESRSASQDARLLHTGAELLAYLGVEEAHVPDMGALTECLEPVPRREQTRVVRINHPYDLVQSIINAVGGGHAFHDPVPLSIPEAPRPKRQLPEGYEERLREPEKLTPSDDIDQTACIMCYENRKSVKLFPCEHMSTCDTCFESLMVSDTCQKTCPECRGDIESFKSVGKLKRIKGSK